MKIDLTNTDKQILATHSSGARGRCLLELMIVDALIQAATKSGFSFEIEDSEEGITSIDKLKLALFDLDDALLEVRDDGTGCFRGWIRLVFGNNGWDLISDYSVNLEEFLKPVNEVAKFWGG